MRGSRAVIGASHPVAVTETILEAVAHVRT
ncbi:hypothetical protein HD593_004941 [Nonomuraea rubra]|uniref:Uncharacterized protein n=1 Tax=Nonomuraea rubra TaxID=46180 RepID=A0A7X0NVH0_9ACTN|nr:hypothetical protein [Nonomuraea rubra]